jgi:hypothetical protein
MQPTLEDPMFRTLTELQNGATFYVITLGLAVLVALFGPTGSDGIQILNMLTVTAGVLLMLLVVTPDGYQRAGWAQLGLHHAGFRYWPVALLAPTAVLVASYGAATLLGAVSWRFAPDTAVNLAVNMVIISLVCGYGCTVEYPKDRVEGAVRDYHGPEAAGCVPEIPVEDSGGSANREEQ